MSPPTRKPELEFISDGRDLFVVLEGVKIAKRGHPGTAQAKTWISLESRYEVIDHNDLTDIEIHI